MISLKAFRSVLFLALLLSDSFLWAAEGIISKVPVSSGSFCHLKFPAIREQTLYSSRPVLKDPNEGDIVDFYGSCDHDPLGKDEIQSQRVQYRQQRLRQVPEGD